MYEPIQSLIRAIPPVLVVLVVALASLTGCVVAEETAKEEPKVRTAKYTFTPPSEAVAGSSPVTFLQIRPEFIESFDYPGLEPFSGFATSLESDMQELIAARGFTARGPFQTADEVVFSDKQQSDFYMHTNLDLGIDISSVKASEQHTLASLISDTEPKYRFVGDVRLEGKIRLTAVETLTGERLWVKTVDLPGKTVAVDGINDFGMDEFARAIQRDPGVRNPLTGALEQYYQTFMEATWAYLDPAEMEVLKEQADKLKERKRY